MKPAPPPSFLAWIERSLLLGLLCASLATILLVAKNRLTPEQQPVSFGLVYGIAFAVCYGATALLAGSLLWPAIPRAARSIAMRAALVLVAASFLALAATQNRRSWRLLVALPDSLRFRILLPIAAVLAVAGLVVLAAASWRRASWPRLAVAVTLGTTLAALWPAAPPTLPRSGAAPLPTASGPPLIVIGVDGGDWHVIEPLIARGELPHLAALRRQGVWGPLKTLRPCLSPAVWTTIATGAPPSRHGIADFTRARLRGVGQTLPSLAPVKGLGFPWIESLLFRTGMRYESAAISGDRRVPAYWNISTLARSPLAVVAWWITWPAEPVKGYVVSDRLFFTSWNQRTLTHPPELFDTLRPQFYRRADITLDKARELLPSLAPEALPDFQAGRGQGPIERELADAIVRHETQRRIALALLERGRVEFGRTIDLLVVFRTTDIVSHMAMRYSDLVDDHLGASPESLRRYGSVLANAYLLVDRTIGEILDAAGDASVVVVSDHGFALEPKGGGRDYSHETNGPDGIFVASGRPFATGVVGDLAVQDILPILLRARGLPMTPDLAARVDARVFRPEFLRATPPMLVKDYAGWQTPSLQPSSDKGDEEMFERLRALGYLN